MSPRFATLTAVLDHWAEARPDVPAFRFLEDGETAETTLTFAELRRQALGVAAHLGPSVVGRPLLVVCEPGLDFLAAFLGAIAAGAIAVPASPPTRAEGLESLRRIARDCGATQTLTTAVVLERLTRQFSPADVDAALGERIAVDGLAGLGAPFTAPAARPSDVCLIQYTSGSTSRPTGVVLSHRNILHNQEAIRRAFAHDSDSTVVVGWLPQFHDMGLIGNVLQPLFLGRCAVLLSPLHVLQRPARWLQAIARYRATTSGAPDFAYDLCVDKIRDEDLDALDLSSWRVAFNGAEPIRAATMRRFARRFARCGFVPGAFLPCYGLAEATLFVVGARAPSLPSSGHFDKAALTQGRAVAVAASPDAAELVCLGAPAAETVVKIVDPETGRERGPGDVGEIWIDGPGVGLGYHGDPAATAAVFAARLADAADERRYLRTGDLGFLVDGGLYFASRAKDLIIIRGKNHYPQDIERSVWTSLPATKRGRSAAFLADGATRDALVVVQEVRATALPRAESLRLRALVAETVTRVHQLRPAAVLLVPTGSIPQTSSGKVRRGACKELYQGGRFREL